MLYINNDAKTNSVIQYAEQHAAYIGVQVNVIEGVSAVQLFEEINEALNKLKQRYERQGYDMEISNYIFDKDGYDLY
jgi:ethanolamine ammonia-lyase small subunit